ncbi:uncharacterized protein BYT42DRAFT_32424 [Radiomyces spectabilis]|uniref:uncharacterized protein n=1 Tax=Radiomyces spectabilis TaxID=64574 RepID=UPI00222046C6|nr:uncharacterized protein BYT42DRAFT_32424 [Radiomyces spectabilis]KAI8394139.1 hypothetical protein BYT42DRAFT_32424 [Radiomyces spectabilis]
MCTRRLFMWRNEINHQAVQPGSENRGIHCTACFQLTSFLLYTYPCGCHSRINKYESRHGSYAVRSLMKAELILIFGCIFLPTSNTRMHLQM